MRLLIERITLVIAWTGIALVLASSVPTFNISCSWITSPETAGRVTEGIIVSVILGILGFLLAMIAGFFSNNRRVSLGIIIAGVIYLLAFIPWILLGNNEWVLALFPSVLCIIGGFVLKVSRYRGWWFAAVFVVPVVIVAGAAGIYSLLNTPEYQPVQLKMPEETGSEITLSLGPAGGHYSLVSTGSDGYTWEYLRIWDQGTSSRFIAVETPQDGMLMPLLHMENITLDRISVPCLGYSQLERISPTESLLVEYRQTSWSFNMKPACVSYTKHGDEEYYMIFRLKEHTPGEQMVIEYTYVQPADP
jgi:hypothetical protein